MSAPMLMCDDDSAADSADDDSSGGAKENSSSDSSAASSSQARLPPLSHIALDSPLPTCPAAWLKRPARMATGGGIRGGVNSSSSSSSVSVSGVISAAGVTLSGDELSVIFSLLPLTSLSHASRVCSQWSVRAGRELTRGNFIKRHCLQMRWADNQLAIDPSPEARYLILVYRVRLNASKTPRDGVHGEYTMLIDARGENDATLQRVHDALLNCGITDPEKDARQFTPRMSKAFVWLCSPLDAVVDDIFSATHEEMASSFAEATRWNLEGALRAIQRAGFGGVITVINGQLDAQRIDFTCCDALLPSLSRALQARSAHQPFKVLSPFPPAANLDCAFEEKRAIHLLQHDGEWFNFTLNVLDPTRGMTKRGLQLAVTNHRPLRYFLRLAPEERPDYCLGNVTEFESYECAMRGLDDLFTTFVGVRWSERDRVRHRRIRNVFTSIVPSDIDDWAAWVPGSLHLRWSSHTPCAPDAPPARYRILLFSISFLPSSPHAPVSSCLLLDAREENDDMIAAVAVILNASTDASRASRMDVGAQAFWFEWMNAVKRLPFNWSGACDRASASVFDFELALKTLAQRNFSGDIFVVNGELDTTKLQPLIDATKGARDLRQSSVRRLIHQLPSCVLPTSQPHAPSYFPSSPHSSSPLLPVDRRNRQCGISHVYRACGVDFSCKLRMIDDDTGDMTVRTLQLCESNFPMLDFHTDEGEFRLRYHLWMSRNDSANDSGETHVLSSYGLRLSKERAGFEGVFWQLTGVKWEQRDAVRGRDGVHWTLAAHSANKSASSASAVPESWCDDEEGDADEEGWQLVEEEKSDQSVSGAADPPHRARRPPPPASSPPAVCRPSFRDRAKSVSPPLAASLPSKLIERVCDFLLPFTRLGDLQTASLLSRHWAAAAHPTVDRALLNSSRLRWADPTNCGLDAVEACYRLLVWQYGWDSHWLLLDARPDNEETLAALHSLLSTQQMSSGENCFSWIHSTPQLQRCVARGDEWQLVGLSDDEMRNSFDEQNGALSVLQALRLLHTTMQPVVPPLRVLNGRLMSSAVDRVLAQRSINGHEVGKVLEQLPIFVAASTPQHQPQHHPRSSFSLPVDRRLRALPSCHSADTPVECHVYERDGVLFDCVLQRDRDDGGVDCMQLQLLETNWLPHSYFLFCSLSPSERTTTHAHSTGRLSGERPELEFEFQFWLHTRVEWQHHSSAVDGEGKWPSEWSPTAESRSNFVTQARLHRLALAHSKPDRALEEAILACDTALVKQLLQSDEVASAPLSLQVNWLRCALRSRTGAESDRLDLWRILAAAWPNALRGGIELLLDVAYSSFAPQPIYDQLLAEFRFCQAESPAVSCRLPACDVWMRGKWRHSSDARAIMAERTTAELNQQPDTAPTSAPPSVDEAGTDAACLSSSPPRVSNSRSALNRDVMSLVASFVPNRVTLHRAAAVCREWSSACQWRLQQRLISEFDFRFVGSEESRSSSSAASTSIPSSAHRSRLYRLLFYRCLDHCSLMMLDATTPESESSLALLDRLLCASVGADDSALVRSRSCYPTFRWLESTAGLEDECNGLSVSAMRTSLRRAPRLTLYQAAQLIKRGGNVHGAEVSVVSSAFDEAKLLASLHYPGAEVWSGGRAHATPLIDGVMRDIATFAVDSSTPLSSHS